jgi:hypothetical protein
VELDFRVDTFKPILRLGSKLDALYLRAKEMETLSLCPSEKARKPSIIT